MTHDKALQDAGASEHTYTEKHGRKGGPKAASCLKASGRIHPTQ